MEPDRIITALVARRRELCLRQVDVARGLRISASTIGSWECGALEPSLRRLREWCRLLGVALTVVEAADVIGDVDATA